MRIATGSKRSSFEPQTDKPGLCQWPGCERHGEYRAPESRSALNSYIWFCLEHVREYNSTWNYYAGMSEKEIEADVRRDTVWQRPTWRLGQDPRNFSKGTGAFRDDFGFFESGESASKQRSATPEEKALMALDLTAPVTVAIVKKRYKELVKKHHPDANGGDKAAEERFKVISEAYRTIMHCLSA